MYSCQLQIPESGILKCRVYLWHVNKCKFDIYVACILRLTGNNDDSAELTNHKWIRDYAMANDPAPAGLCLAKAILLESLDNFNPTSATLDKDIDLVLPSAGSSVQEDRVIGVVHEFTIEGTPGDLLSIRTVASATTNFGGPNVGIFSQFEPGSTTIFHQRGCWPYSQILVTVDGIAFDAADYTNPIKDARSCADRYSISTRDDDGPDISMYHWRGETLDPHGSRDLSNPDGPNGNKGLRGVVCRYRVTAQNTDETAGREIAAFLRARDTNNYWQGAAWAFEETPPNPAKMGVLPIRENDNPAYEHEQGVKLNQCQIGTGPTSRDITVRIVHGSTGSCPVDLQYWAGPVGQPIDPPQT